MSSWDSVADSYKSAEAAAKDVANGRALRVKEGSVVISHGKVKCFFPMNPDDIMVKSKDGKIVIASKKKLAARSPVFARMLQSNMLESQRSLIEISDFDYSVVRSMIDFFSHNLIFVSHMEIVPDLLRLGEKYDIKEMKPTLERTLSDPNIFLTKENVEDLLILAKLHNANFLLARATEYLHAIGQREGYEQFPRVGAMIQDGQPPIYGVLARAGGQWMEPDPSKSPTRF